MSTGTTRTAREQALRTLLIAAALSVGVYGLFWLLSAEKLLGVLGLPLTALSKLSHNLGHWLGAKLLGADYGYASIHSADVTLALHRAGCCAAEQSAIIVAGLVMPSLAAFTLFAAARRPTLARYLILLLAVPGFFALLVAMDYLAWAFIGVLYFSYRVIYQRHGASLVLAVLAMQLCLWNAFEFDGVFGHKEQAIDIAQLAQALGLPYRLCAAIPLICPLVILWLGSRYYLRPGRSQRALAKAVTNERDLGRRRVARAWRSNRLARRALRA